MRRRTFGQVILALWALGLPGSAGPLPESGFLQSVDLKGLPGGGYSALHLSDQGREAVVMTDKGGVFRLTLTRDAEGRVTGLAPGKLTRLKDTNGKPLIEGQTDTEGLAVSADGRAWVSTEGTARVLAYGRLDGTPKRTPRPKAFAQFPGNTAFESLALAPDGTLWLIPEAPVRAGDPYPTFLWRGKSWEAGPSLARQGFWMAADATFDPQGRLYLLERLFAGPAGFASRIRRFDLDSGEVAVVMRSPLGLHDNLEGISVWHDGTGLRATMVSDDNFLKLFRSELVEYRLPE